MAKNFQVTYRLLVEKEGGKSEWLEVTGEDLGECYKSAKKTPGAIGVVGNKKITDNDALETRIAKEIFRDTMTAIEDIEEDDFIGREWYEERNDFYRHLLYTFSLSKPVDGLKKLKALWSPFNRIVETGEANVDFTLFFGKEYDKYLEQIIEVLEIDDKTAQKMREFYNGEIAFHNGKLK